jgi:hypothetical protein
VYRAYQSGREGKRLCIAAGARIFVRESLCCKVSRSNYTQLCQSQLHASRDTNTETLKLSPFPPSTHSLHAISCPTLLPLSLIQAFAGGRLHSATALGIDSDKWPLRSIHLPSPGYIFLDLPATKAVIGVKDRHYMTDHVVCE